ncbi:MAG: AMIN domain-containing protein, partial [Bdellovibrionales bacterium]|nr:AMIN domain-containing protein [Bdellovibrionales bacterium]
MGVLSKALTAAILVSFMGGCAANNTVRDMGPDQTGMAQESANDAIGGSEGMEQSALQQTDPAAEVLATASQTGVDVRLERLANATRVMIDTGSEQPLFDIMEMDQPQRLVIDLLGREGVSNRSVAVENNAFLNRVRFGKHPDRARIVLDLGAMHPQHDVKVGPNGTLSI